MDHQLLFRLWRYRESKKYPYLRRLFTEKRPETKFRDSENEIATKNSIAPEFRLLTAGYYSTCNLIDAIAPTANVFALVLTSTM